MSASEGDDSFVSAASPSTDNTLVHNTTPVFDRTARQERRSALFERNALLTSVSKRLSQEFSDSDRETSEDRTVVMGSTDLTGLVFPELANWPKFSGEGSLTRFTRALNERCNLLGWDGDKVKYVMPFLLSKEAKEFYHNYDDSIKADYKLVLKKLKEDFMTELYSGRLMREITTMKQGEKESAMEFANKVSDIADDMDEADAVRESLKKTNLLRGMKKSIRDKLTLDGNLDGDFKTLKERAIKAETRQRMVTDEVTEVTKSVNAMRVDDRRKPERRDKKYDHSRDHFRRRDAYRNESGGYGRSREHYSERNAHYDRRRSRSRDYDRGRDNRGRGDRGCDDRGRDERYRNRSYSRGRDEYSNRDRRDRSYSRGRDDRYERRSHSRDVNTRGGNRSRGGDNRGRSSERDYERQDNRRDSRRDLRDTARGDDRRSRSGDRKVRFESRSPPRSSSLRLTPFSLFVVAAIMSLSAMPVGAFQICGKGKSGYAMAFPDIIDCNTRNTAKVLLTQADIYVQTTEPVKFKGAHCFNKTRIICTSSFLHWTLNVESDNTYTTPVKEGMCREMAAKHAFGSNTLRQYSNDVFGTDNQVTYSYPLMGQQCSTTTNLYVEHGEIASFDGRVMISNIGDLGGCKIDDLVCLGSHGTIVWDGKPRKVCKYEMSTTGVAYATERHVVVDRVQVAFNFKNVSYTAAQKRAWCLPETAQAMDNGVFVDFAEPALQPYLHSMSFSSVVQLKPRLIDQINERHANDSKLLRFDHRPRRGRRDTAAILKGVTHKTEQFLKADRATNWSKSVEATHLAKLNHVAPNFTLSNNLSITHEQRQDERHRELNTKVQYLSVKLQEDLNRDFHYLWNKVCIVTNMQYHSIRSLALLDATAAARMLLQREDVSADVAGGALIVHKCREVAPTAVYYDKKVKGVCYRDVPVMIGDRMMFLTPGTVADLMPASPAVDCAHQTMSIYKDRNGEWRSPIGRVHVSEVNYGLADTTRTQSDLVFSAPPIYHSDLAGIESALQMIYSRVNRLDDKADLSGDVMSSDFLNQEKDKLVRDIAGAGHVLEHNAREIMQHGARELATTVTSAVLAVIGVLIVAMVLLMCVALCVVCYVKITCLRITLSRVGHVLRRVLCCCNSGKKTPSNDIEGGQVSYNRGNESITMVPPQRPASPSAPRRYPTLDTASTASADSKRSKRSLKQRITEALTYLPIVMSLVCTVGASEVHRPIHVWARLDHAPVRAMIDTGSSITFIRESELHSLDRKMRRYRGPNARAANDTVIPILAEVELFISIGRTRLRHTVLVTEDKYCPASLVVGVDFLRKMRNVSFEFESNQMTVSNDVIPFISAATYDLSTGACAVRLAYAVSLKPHTDNYVSAYVDGAFRKDAEILTESDPDVVVADGVSVASSLGTPGLHGIVQVRIRNSGNGEVKMYKGQRIALAEEISDSRKKRPLVFAVYPEKLTSDWYSSDKSEVEQAADYVPPEVDLSADMPRYPDNQGEIEQIDWTGSTLNAEEQSIIEDLVDEFREAFVGIDGDLGLYSGDISHRIELKADADPPKQRAIRIPIEQRGEVQMQIEEMLRQRIIEPSTSPFCAPIVLVRKKDNSWRFVVDYRRLNAITAHETYIIPHIQEILDLAGGKQYYSTLDFKSGFHQIRMDSKDKEKTAFNSPLGLFQFVTMPMGLKGAPGTFQRVANSLVRELKCAAFAYLDDIIISSDTFEEHVEDLREVFERVLGFGMKLRLGKCTFAQPEVKFLGVCISEKGCRPNPEKVKSISQYPVPDTPTGVKAFLGAVGFFRRFIENFAGIAAPLNDLMKKGVTFKWGEAQQAAFVELKDRLCKAPILAPPQPGVPYEVHTDASKTAVAGCLLQMASDGSGLRAIAYSSRSLNKHERRYPVIELEALAIIHCLKAFHPYVADAKIKIVTDHAPLRSLLTRRDLVGRLAKYQIALQGYDCTIDYRPGKLNPLADALSRYIVSAVERGQAHPKFPDRETIRAAQEKCPHLGEFMRYLLDSSCAKPAKLAELNSKWNLVNGLLVVRETNATYIPAVGQLRESVTLHFHSSPFDGGHLGAYKTYEKMKNAVFWRGMKSAVEKIVQGCDKCQRIKTHAAQSNRSRLGEFELPSRPFDRIHSDIIGPFTMTTGGHVYIQITVCAFSKYVICTPLADQQTETVARALIDDVISKHGVPEILVTDRGTNYMSKVFKETCNLLGIDHCSTTAYHHQSNGQAERMVKVVTECLAAFVNEFRNDWHEHLQLVVFALNSSVNSTSDTAFYIVHGRDPRLVSHAILNTAVSKYKDVADYCNNLTIRVQSIYNGVRQKLATNNESMQHYYNQKGVQETELTLGGLVLVRDDTARPKLTDNWKGPYRVVDMDEQNVTVQQIGKEKTDKIHRNRIKGTGAFSRTVGF